MNFTANRNVQIGETLFEGEHESGLKVYVMPKAGYSKSAAYFATNYGSVDRMFQGEDDPEPMVVPDGIAHFLEHKMFEEEDGTNVFEAFSKYGANANAYTSFTMTSYYFTCMSDLYENLDILLEFVTHPYYTPENVEKEQGIIGQEIRRYDDDPEWRLYFNAIKCMYHNHPVKIDIAGTVESIAKITDQTLYSVYERFYDPSNMALFVIGDCTPEAVAEVVDRHITRKTAKAPVRRFFEEEPTDIVQNRWVQKLPVASTQFILAFKDDVVGGTPLEMLKRSVVTEMVLGLLAEESSSLYWELYESGMITGSLDTEYDMEKTYAFSMMSGEGKDPDSVKERILAEVARIAENGFSPEEVERAKKNAYGHFLKTLNSVENIGTNFLADSFKSIHSLTEGEIIMSVTKEDLDERLRTHLSEKNCVLSIVCPEREVEG